MALSPPLNPVIIKSEEEALEAMAAFPRIPLPCCLNSIIPKRLAVPVPTPAPVALNMEGVGEVVAVPENPGNSSVSATLLSTDAT